MNRFKKMRLCWRIRHSLQTMELTGAIFGVHGVGGNRAALDIGGRCANVETTGSVSDESSTASVGKIEDFSFVQISDSHIGFNKGANPDVTGTLQKAIDRINVRPAGMKAPDLMIHTGDITQNSKTQEFDTAMQVIKGAKVGEVFYVPGEHDYSLDDGALYKQHFGKGTLGNGWYSLNHKVFTFWG